MSDDEHPIIRVSPEDVKIKDVISLHGTYWVVHEIQKLKGFYSPGNPYWFYRFFTFDIVTEYRTGSFIDIKEIQKVWITKNSE